MDLVAGARPYRRWCLQGLALALAAHASVAGAQSIAGQQEQRERAQRDAERREQQRTEPDVRLQESLAPGYRQIGIPRETPCFQLATLILEGPHSGSFGFLQRYLDQYRGQCVGQQGLALIAHRASDFLLARGYVTSRVVIPEQSLGEGRLRVVLLAGTLGEVRLAPGSAAVNWRSALPLRPGDIINLRAIEQGLEQLKRLSSLEATIDIAPGSAPGTSDLVLTVARGRPWHLSASLDDSGAESTGKTQGGLNLALDQPLGLNDLMVLGASHSFGDYNHERGTHGMNASESLPWGNWTFNAFTNSYGYRQPLTAGGADTTFSYTGNSQTAGISAMRLLHRDAHSKTSLQLTISGRDAHSYVNGTEIDTQRRRTRALELALIERRYLGSAQLDVRLAYRHNVPWFDGQWTRGIQGGPSFHVGVTTLDASIGLPFQLFGQRWQWMSELHGQASGDKLYAEDYITIGSRYTVRGFDGNLTLGGAHGYYWRNTLNLPLGNIGAAAYGGVDVGRVGGAPAFGESGEPLQGRSLSGVVLGLRGSRWGLSWDLFAGWALQRPDGLVTRRPAAGMQWIYSY